MSEQVEKAGSGSVAGTRRSLVVIGASAGGVEALGELVAGLPADLPAAVAVVLHIPQEGGSVLPAILSRRGALPATHARSGESLLPGRIYVAPPDRHVLVEDGRVLLSRGPRENGHRPAVDVLFRSAARARAEEVVGVVLSGTLDDGADGLATIVRYGGVAVVQSPEDAVFPSMPRHALDRVVTEHVAAAGELGKLINELCRTPVLAPTVPPRNRSSTTLLERETAMAQFNAEEVLTIDQPGEAAGLTCPDCNGSLFRLGDDELLRFRCRVGHAWSGNALMAEHSVALESALWLALRTLEDRMALSRRMAHQAHARGSEHSARRFERSADDARRAAEEIAGLLKGNSPVTRMIDPSVEQADA